MPAELGSAHRAPCDAEAGAVETAEWAGKTFDVGQQVGFGDEAIFEHDFAGDRGAQGEFAFDLRRGETLGAAFDDETADHAIFGLGPDHRDIGDGGIGDPHLRTVEAETARLFHRACLHAAGVGTGIGLGEAEATDEFTAGEFGQIFLSLLLGAVGEDGMHHERILHAHGGTITRIDTFDFARDKAIGHIVHVRAAIFFGQREAEEADLAHLVHDLAIEIFVAEAIAHAGQQLVGAIVARAVAHHAFFAGQLVFEQKRV